MKIEEIENLWEDDSKMDKSSLDVESLRIPQLHHKYYKIFLRERILLDKKQFDFNVIYKEKWELYTGKLDQQTLEERGWEQFDLKIIRQDLDKYLDADKQLIDKKLELVAQKEKVKFLEDIIKTVNNRAFQIKNAVDFIRWTNGG